MAAEERQHEERHAIMVEAAGAAALADCGFPEKPAVRAFTTEGTELHRVVSLVSPTCSVYLCDKEGVSSRSGDVHARKVFPDISAPRPWRPAWDLRFEWPGDIHLQRARAGRWY